MSVVQAPHTVDLAWLDESRPQLIAYLNPFVRALVGGEPKPEVIGSAVLATYQSRPVLLTAKHVIEEFEERHLHIELPDRFQFVRLSPDRVAENAQRDAAVVLLPEEALAWDVPFLDLEAQDGTTVSRGEVEIYVAMGFPSRESAVDRAGARLELRSVNYWGFENREAYRLLQLSREEFVTTSFDTKNAYRDGVKRQMKRPHGMSGGALWRLSPEGIELAGILTEYQQAKTKCAVSTRICVLQALAAELTRGG